MQKLILDLIQDWKHQTQQEWIDIIVS
jgi:hypothetical protein